MWFWHISSKKKFINFAKAFLSIFKKSLIYNIVNGCMLLLLLVGDFHAQNLSKKKGKIASTTCWKFATEDRRVGGLDARQQDGKTAEEEEKIWE